MSDVKYGSKLPMGKRKPYSDLPFWVTLRTANMNLNEANQYIWDNTDYKTYGGREPDIGKILQQEIRRETEH